MKLNHPAILHHKKPNFLESYNGFNHISVEFTTSPIVSVHKVNVFLIYNFSFQQHIFGHEPTSS